jgi:Holliday junction resolvase
MYRRASATDANQAEIVSALRAVGASVQPLHSVGQGTPDLLIGFGGVNYLIEIKDGSRKPSERKLSKRQVEWHSAWRGQVSVAETVSQALLIIGVYP